MSGSLFEFLDAISLSSSPPSPLYSSCWHYVTNCKLTLNRKCTNLMPSALTQTYYTCNHNEWRYLITNEKFIVFYCPPSLSLCLILSPSLFIWIRLFAKGDVKTSIQMFNVLFIALLLLWLLSIVCYTNIDSMIISDRQRLQPKNGYMNRVIVLP